MRNYVQKGENLTVPAPYNVLSGELAVVGSIYGVAGGNAASGEPVDLTTVGVFELPKVSALAIAIGDKVYWQSAEKLISKTSAGNTYVGVATSVAANPSGSVNVRLNGTF